MTDLEEILTLLDPPKRASLEAEVMVSGEEVLDVIGHWVYWINVSGSAEQLAELINRGYEGTDDFMRSVDDALAIARGESTGQKAAREAREAVQRRELVERCLGAFAEAGVNAVEIPKPETKH